MIDGHLPLAEISLDLVADLERLAPFGPGNPRLTLVSPNHSLAGDRTIGRYNEHRLLTVEDATGARQQVIWWQGAGWPLPEGRFDLAYSARASTWRGQRNVQIEWSDARPVPDAVVVIPPARPGVVDQRRTVQTAAVLADVRAQPGVQVWCEGEARRALGGQDRSELTPGDTLVIWTIPPGRAELQTALNQVRPRQVVIFAADPGMDQLEAFVQRLAGLVKRNLRDDEGMVSMERLAAATAQRTTVVRSGLRWLAGRGYVRITAEQGDALRLATGDPSTSTDIAATSAQLRALLAETAAFRRYFSQADAEVLLN
jgi:single-stranded-DNA-specific exonuclease